MEGKTGRKAGRRGRGERTPLTVRLKPDIRADLERIADYRGTDIVSVINDMLSSTVPTELAEIHRLEDLRLSARTAPEIV